MPISIPSQKAVDCKSVHYIWNNFNLGINGRSKLGPYKEMKLEKWHRPTFSQYFGSFKPSSIWYSRIIGGFQDSSFVQEIFIL